MQKRKFIFLFLVAALLCFSNFAEAALQFLPRYQGAYTGRSQDGGKDKICHPSYQYACEGEGYSGGSGSSCNNLYVSCTCATGYKWSGGSCVLKGCSDYGYQANEDTTKSCEEKTPRTDLSCYACTSCDSSTYQYTCTGGLNANEQGTENKCGVNYSECSCVENAVWTNGKCECKADYKTSGSSCVLKTCEDYGYQSSEDTSKDCSKQTPRSNLECWSCSSCTGTLYDCSSITNANGADTSSTSCGGKYAKCTCATGYFWNNGSCEKSCTPLNCTSGTNCKDENGTAASCTMAGSVSDGVAAYSTCSSINCNNEGYKTGYRATRCNTDKDGWVLSNGLCNCEPDIDYKHTSSECSNAACRQGCNDKYQFNSCDDGYAGYDIGNCPIPETTDCSTLGYTATTCAKGETALRCPFGDAVFCISPTK